MYILAALRTPLQTRKIYTNRGILFLCQLGSLDWQRVDFWKVLRWDGKILCENELTLLAELELAAWTRAGSAIP